MKKMMIIAALISGMLMPAQIMAKNNNRNEKARVENRGPQKEVKIVVKEKRGKKEKYDDCYKYNKPGKKQYKKFGKCPKPVVIVNQPAPRPRPVCRYNNNPGGAVNAAAAVIGIAGLIAILAN